MSQEYIKLKQRLLREKRLFVDPQFPANSTSLHQPSTDIKWLRPKEITPNNAKFIEGVASRFDLEQGDLGDCWFLSSAACLATSNKELFDKVVHPEQSFDADYCGLFRFNFWRMGVCEEVIIDDRLPTRNGALIYTHNNEEPNEYWAALLEKAYAKLNGCSYKNINMGRTVEALVDLTGGVPEVIDFRDLENNGAKRDFFTLVQQALRLKSMVACCANDKADPRKNGLLPHHAYTILQLEKVKLKTNVEVRLVRVRNPWGRGEWKGAWSDFQSPDVLEKPWEGTAQLSNQWNLLSDSERKRLGVQAANEGEFWMSFEDWLTYFSELHFCHLSPDAFTEEEEEGLTSKLQGKHWNTNSYTGSWRKGFNAGGSPDPKSKNPEIFWTNSQYGVTVMEEDDEDKDGQSTLIACLTQSAPHGSPRLFIGIYVFKIKSGQPALTQGSRYDGKSLSLVYQPKFLPSRDFTVRVKVAPGNYVLMPCTYNRDEEANFLLRLYAEKKPKTTPVVGTTIVTKSPSMQDSLLKVFDKYSKGDKSLDCYELTGAINEIFSNVFKTGMTVDGARTLLTLTDKDKSGFLEYDEFKNLVMDMQHWKDNFVQYDKDRSGTIDTYELRETLAGIGIQLSETVLWELIKKYSGKARCLCLEDFMICCARIFAAHGLYSSFQKKNIGISLDEWMTTLIYY